MASPASTPLQHGSDPAHVRIARDDGTDEFDGCGIRSTDAILQKTYHTLDEPTPDSEISILLAAPPFCFEQLTQGTRSRTPSPRLGPPPHLYLSHPFPNQFCSLSAEAPRLQDGESHQVQLFHRLVYELGRPQLWIRSWCLWANDWPTRLLCLFQTRP